MIDDYRKLMSKASRLYEKHEASRPEPFNVFSILLSAISPEYLDALSVLRSEVHEVNFHSRFLQALLAHRRPPDGRRENLADFLRMPAARLSTLNPDQAVFDRESGRGVLIRDPSTRQAVFIDNNVRVGNQPGQLDRYSSQLKAERYSPNLLFLTLDGLSPPENSVRCREYECISYKEDLFPWLRRCQQRAYDEPALRESVAQYLHLVARLTGRNYSETYMNELEKLCLKNDNLLLVPDLNEAFVETKVSLLYKLWQEIATELGEQIPDLPDLSKDVSDISKDTIRRYLTSRKCIWHGLYFSFDRGAFLGIVAEDAIRFGVVCSKQMNRHEMNELLRALEGDPSVESWTFWKCPKGFEYLNLRNSSRKDLEMLTNRKERKKYVKEIVSGLHGVWERIKEAGLA